MDPALFSADYAAGHPGRAALSLAAVQQWHAEQVALDAHLARELAYWRRQNGLDAAYMVAELRRWRVEVDA